jgi:hypothetical protein
MNSIDEKIEKSIYVLIDPFTDAIRYVGAANDPRYRLRQHKIPSYIKKSKTPKSKWIKELKENGGTPVMEVIDIVGLNEWEFWEAHYISLFKSWGFNLLNLTQGGKGLTGYKASEETKCKMRVPKHTTETRKAISEKMKGRVFKPETREKLSRLHKGRKQTPEAIENMRQSKLGKPGWNKGLKAERINGKLVYKK